MHPDTVPCLVELAEEFDTIGPRRDHASDGSIGNQEHRSRSSNHNPDDTAGTRTPQTDSDGEPDIRAIDVDDSGPWLNGASMGAATELIVARCRSGVENRLVEVIYNRRAAYASNDWRWIDYHGANAHTEHAHFGAKADSGKLENDRRPWGLVEKWGGDDMLVGKGDRSEEVTFWQYILEDLGYDVGSVDGVYGDKMAAAVNASRRKFKADAGPANSITGWHAFRLLSAHADKRAGKQGAPGKDGAPGRNGTDGRNGADGKDGVFTGTLDITGGRLTAVSPEGN